MSAVIAALVSLAAPGTAGAENYKIAYGGIMVCGPAMKTAYGWACTGTAKWSTACAPTYLGNRIKVTTAPAGYNITLRNVYYLGTATVAYVPC